MAHGCLRTDCHQSIVTSVHTGKAVEVCGNKLTIKAMTLTVSLKKSRVWWLKRGQHLNFFIDLEEDLLFISL